MFLSSYNHSSESTIRLFVFVSIMQSSVHITTPHQVCLCASFLLHQCALHSTALFGNAIAAPVTALPLDPKQLCYISVQSSSHSVIARVRLPTTLIAQCLACVQLPTTKLWLAVKDAKERDEAPFHQEMAAEVYEYYFRNYAVHFSSEGMSTAFATIPQVGFSQACQSVWVLSQEIRCAFCQ